MYYENRINWNPIVIKKKHHQLDFICTPKNIYSNQEVKEEVYQLIVQQNNNNNNISNK